MEVMDGVETAKKLSEQYPELRIVILSSYFSKAFVINMLEIGAAAYLPKNSTPEEVETSLREVAE
jgi:DNA-binding NarL/FixJ family response regulator